MKKFSKKKGFTIIELVIVIAVIAILAAVMIPTFSNVISKANESNALSAARSAYTEWLATDNNALLDTEKKNVCIKSGNYYFHVTDGQFSAEASETDVAGCAGAKVVVYENNFYYLGSVALKEAFEANTKITMSSDLTSKSAAVCSVIVNGETVCYAELTCGQSESTWTIESCEFSGDLKFGEEEDQKVAYNATVGGEGAVTVTNLKTE